jgi:4-methylaminobutanoate oxidase (formaldehyde-forming)
MHLPPDGSVSIEDETEKLGCLGLWGPAARRVLALTCGDDLSNAAFPYMTGQSIEVGGRRVWAQRISYVGELGWEFYVNPADAPAVWDALMAAGEQWGIRPAGYKALDALRIEKGYRYWSGDITPADNPLEAGLEMFVDLAKPNFIGRKALLDLKARGLPTRLTAITMDAGGNLYGGESVYAGDQIVGRIRTGNHGYSIGQDIGLVYLPVELAKVNTEVAVQVFGKRVKARVADLPLVDPMGEKLKRQ